MDNQNIIDQRIEQKNKRIQEYRSETALSIQLGQSINLAVEVLGKESKDEVALDVWTDYFFKFIDKKRKEVFDQNEKMYAQNPAPTVEAWENMTEVQQKFLKDKQLEKNRAAYQARKDVTPAESLAARVASKQSQNLMSFKQMNDDKLKQ